LRHKSEFRDENSPKAVPRDADAARTARNPKKILSRIFSRDEFFFCVRRAQKLFNAFQLSFQLL
jgi:hypothetical protein